MNYRLRSYQKELLDRPDIPFGDIRRNMIELEFINRWLGGHAITVAGLKGLLNGSAKSAQQEVSICEIGCGGGDNLHAINEWLKHKGIKADLTGIDINPECVQYAREKDISKRINFITSDFRDVEFLNPPDYVFCSLFGHHLDDAGFVEMLDWMRSRTGKGFFINDLHRHPLAYHSIKALTNVFSKSYLVKNDAPLSVLRGFTKNEIIGLMQRAGIKDYHISWKWAFRWLITCPKSCL